MSYFFNGQRIDKFQHNYMALSGAFCGNTFIDESGKVILPQSALEQISHLNIVWPIMLKLTNPNTGQYTHCGVLEFTADEGNAYVPFWMMQNIGLDIQSIVRVETASLRKGRFVKLRPQETAFIQNSDPKAILEKKLRDFSCLTKGDTIAIKHAGRQYNIDVRELKDERGDCEAVSIVETDINLEFERPLDMPESPPRGSRESGDADDSQMLFDEEPTSPTSHMPKSESKKEKPKYVPFAGEGKRISGKPVSLSSQSSSTPSTTQQPKTPSPTKKSFTTYKPFSGEGRRLR